MGEGPEGVEMRLVNPRFTFAATVSACVLALSACSSTGGTAASGPALQTYTCCSSSDVATVRHPGETMRLHWIVTPVDPSSMANVTTVRLEAGLSGPFASVPALKASNGPETVNAPAIVTTNQAGEAPVSVIQIPKDAPAGYYDLTTTIDVDGGQVSGGAVIQVATR